MADVTEFLCEIWKIVLSQNIVFLRDNLVYSHIRSPLESKGVLSSLIRRKVENSRCNSESVENLILYLTEIQPTKITHFLEILAEKRNGYDFVFQHLKSTYDRYLEGGFDTFSTVSMIETSESKSRKFSQIYRHTLRRLLNENEMKHFRELQRFAIDKWQHRNPHELDYRRVVELSDLYFMVLDSEAETKRLRFETTNFNEDVFQEMINVIPNTSNPARSSMQYQSRLGSYLNMSGKPFDLSKSHIMIAFQQSHTVEACCEKGLLFYTYFNLISKHYDDNPNEHYRKELLRVSNCALNIFSLGDEQIYSDFQRVFFIKMAMVNLGIGLFGHELQGINISTDNLITAEKHLKEVGKPCFWKRMEVRRKMFYFLCLSKVSKLRLDLLSAKRYLRVAFLFAKKGKFQSEKNNIMKTYHNLNTL